jgi:O-antigen ligase/polysaccharide polymerase Wzy-like membrane protein
VKGLILTYILAYGSAIVALGYPLVGFYAFVGLSILRPQFIFGFAGNISNLSVVVGYAMLIGWAVKGFGSWSFGRGRLIVLSLLAFTAWFVLAASMALNPEIAFTQVTPLLKLIMPFLVGVTMMEGEKDWRPLLWTIVLTQGYVAFEQNLAYLKGFNAAAEGFGGMDNNFFGASLVTVIGPAIVLSVTASNWSGRILAAAAAALILHTILLTFSRGTMLGLVAVGATAAFLMPKRPKYIAAMLVVAILVVRFTGPQLAARYATTFASEEERDQSAESRVDLWKDCLKVIQRFPVLGVGPANWQMIATEYGWTKNKSAHSVWMETAAEIGLPGVFVLITFFGLTVVRLWPLARSRKTDANAYEIAVATGVILSIVGFAVAGQFVSAPGLEPPYWVAALGVALLKTAAKREPALSWVEKFGRMRSHGPVPLQGPPFEAPLVTGRYEAGSAGFGGGQRS